tara:strand:- start:27 stop:170 length:144 start_codon:yes stop_codon:yes gene_type:complete
MARYPNPRIKIEELKYGVYYTTTAHSQYALVVVVNKKEFTNAIRFFN